MTEAMSQAATRDNGGRFTAPEPVGDEVNTESTPEPAAAPAVVEPSDEAKKAAAFQQAAEDERHKRQKAQEEAAYWRGQAEAQGRAAPEKKPEDLDLEFMANPSKSVQTAVAAATWATKVELTADAEREKHPDYDEKEAIFGQQRRLHPEIAASPEFQRNPARFAYKWATEYLTPKTNAAPDDLKAKVAELEKTIAELRGAKPAPEIPQTQAGARSVTGHTAPSADEDWLAEATTKRNGKRPF